MPIKDLCAALPEAYLSEEARVTAEALPYRDFMTAGLLVDRLELKNETAHKTLGNLDHSMLAGLCAAELLRTGKKDRHALWEVNTERAYQET